MLVLEFSSICSQYCTINTVIISRAPGIHSDSDIAWVPIHYMRNTFSGILSSVGVIFYVKGPFTILWVAMEMNEVHSGVQMNGAA